MVEEWTRPPVLLGKEQLAWDEDLELPYASDLLLYLFSHSTRQIREQILPTLRIEDAAWPKKGENAPFDDETWARGILSTEQKRNRRGALKGLSMELLCASILRLMDQPRQVNAWVQILGGKPNWAAPAGTVDISARFSETTQSEAFTVVGEVSAWKNMPTTDYLTQLDQGLKHSGDIAKLNPGRVYCLVVNDRKIHVDRNLHEEYLRFLEDNSLTAESDIRMVPMYAPDFAVITGRLSYEPDPENLHFDSYVLAAALDTIYQTLLKPKLPEYRTWMIDKFMETVEANLPEGGAPGGSFPPQ